jgi:hypothetical protein
MCIISNQVVVKGRKKGREEGHSVIKCLLAATNKAGGG